MTSKTIALTGAETKVEYSGGSNAWLRNDGTDVIYAAAVPGIAAGADGVVSIPAGQAAPVYGANGTVYLLGTGSIMLIGSDYAECPFKTSTSSGGSGADEVARAAINQHVGNADVHVTAAEKSGWDGLSNPNLLDNPDFSVNQRGQTSYEQSGSPVVRTVDRWATLIQGTKVDITSSGIKLGFTSTAAAASVIGQTIEGTSLAGRTVTFSVCVAEQTAQHGKLSVNYLSGGERKYNLVDLNKVGVTSITVSIPADATDIRAWIYGADIRVGDTVDSYTTIAWAKLEIGGAATPFVPPDPTTELLKCQRYYQIRSTNDIAPVDLRPSMRTITDIKAVDGGYAYVAEL